MSSKCFVRILQSVNSQGYQSIQTHQCESIFKSTYTTHDLTKPITNSNVQEHK
jgi:hypothetical protein